MRPKASPSVFLLYLIVIFGLVYTNCGRKLAGVYSVSFMILKNCQGIHKSAFEDFKVTIDIDHDGNILIEPLDPSSTYILNGKGTLTEEVISFKGLATGSADDGDFKIAGAFKGDVTGASYIGEVFSLTGYYKGCSYDEVKFVMKRQ